MSDATHVPQQHVDVGARTLTTFVGVSHISSAGSNDDSKDSNSGECSRRELRPSATCTSTALDVEERHPTSQPGPSASTYATNLHQAESTPQQVSSTLAFSSEQSTIVSPTKQSHRSSLSKPKPKSKQTPRNFTNTSVAPSPSAPILVNSPPSMQLPTSLASISGGGSRSYRSSRSKVSPPATSPDPSAFSFASILDELKSDPGATADIEAIARICGRSRLSLANEYGAHRDPVGPGVRVIGEDVTEGLETEAIEQATGLGMGWVGLSGGLETVDETPATSESERVLASDGSPTLGEPEVPEEGDSRPRWGFLGVWEGQQTGNHCSASRHRTVIGSSRPISGVSNIEFENRAELEISRVEGARENLMRLATA